MSAATVFNDDPGGAGARASPHAGCRWLHVVDLDGAFAGKPVNARRRRGDPRRGRRRRCSSAAASAIARPSSAGSRSGVARVMLGTVALQRSRARQGRLPRLSRRIVVGIDARGGRVAVEGWAKTSDDDGARSRARASRMPASPPSSTPTSSATARSTASMSRRRPRWRARLDDAGHRLGRRRRARRSRGAEGA